MLYWSAGSAAQSVRVSEKNQRAFVVGLLEGFASSLEVLARGGIVRRSLARPTARHKACRAVARLRTPNLWQSPKSLSSFQDRGATTRSANPARERIFSSSRGSRAPSSCTRKRRSYTNARPRGCSSVGRAPRSQCGGQGFDPPQLHHFSRLEEPWPNELHRPQPRLRSGAYDSRNQLQCGASDPSVAGTRVCPQRVPRPRRHGDVAHRAQPSRCCVREGS